MAFLVVFVAAYVFGGAALRAFRFQGVCESLVYRIAAGLPLCALLVLALGSVSLSMAQIALYLVAAIGLGRQLLGPSGGDSPELPLGESAPPFSRFEKFCLSVLSAAAVLTFLAAATPVTQDDALPVLGLVQDYYREGRVFVFEGDPQCGGPHLMPCLFAYAFHESGEQGVTLLNWAVGLLGCGALFLLTDRIAGRAAGLIAAAMFSTAPVFFDQAQGASCHLMLVTLSVTALAAWQTWYESEDRRWLMVAAFLAGSCCGIHPSGWIVAVLIPIGTLLAVSPNRVKALGQSVAYIALGAAPWILRAALLTGNPLYPSGPDEWIPLAALDKAGLTELVWFPWAVVMRFFDYGGWVKSPGCLILFLGVPGLLICGRRV
ncbi:MAG: hypothetical protein QG656_943, partial [Candidatus Hydrogenedentes bacterium]|nr:hypothetical protein [Candidatus Hydrogenedentota bacterium]